MIGVGDAAERHGDPDPDQLHGAGKLPEAGIQLKKIEDQQRQAGVDQRVLPQVIQILLRRVPKLKAEIQRQECSSVDHNNIRHEQSQQPYQFFLIGVFSHGIILPKVSQHSRPKISPLRSFVSAPRRIRHISFLSHSRNRSHSRIHSRIRNRSHSRNRSCGRPRSVRRRRS